MKEEAEPSIIQRKTKIEIRKMDLQDIPAVFELGRQLFQADRLPTLYRAWDDREVIDAFNSSQDTCLVAELREEQRIVGFALGRIMEKPQSAWRYGWLEWLGVAPGFKRRRVATRLVKRLIQAFLQHDVRIMMVDTDEENTEAIAFFRKLGFGQELRHVYMSMNLDDYPKTTRRVRKQDTNH